MGYREVADNFVPMPADSGVTHFWIVRPHTEGFNPNEQMLCIRMGSRDHVSVGERMNYATDLEIIDCQSCLEWLHA